MLALVPLTSSEPCCSYLLLRIQNDNCYFDYQIGWRNQTNAFERIGLVLSKSKGTMITRRESAIDGERLGSSQIF
jgi:hypothetical protein